MTLYPGEIDEFRVAQNIPGVLYDPDDTKTVFAEDTNNHSDAIVAIEETLGVDPAGAFATVAGRLNNIDAAAQILHVAEAGLATYASGGYQPVAYNHMLADTANGWDYTNAEYVIPHDGAYMIFASHWWATSFSAGDKKLIVTVNGGEYLGINNPSLVAYETQVLPTGGYFNAGDRIKMWLTQNSGSPQYSDGYISTNYLKIIGIW